MYRLKLRHFFFIIFDLLVRQDVHRYTGRASLIDYEQSVFFISPSSETRKARKQRVISLSSQEDIYSITSNLNYSLK